MTFRNILSQEELKEHLHYNPDTGIFTRIKNLSKKKSTNVGNIDKRGYLHIRINYTRYYAHRLAFLYMTGSIPHYVDHIDRNPSNNKWNNLREADISQNGANVALMKSSTTGYKGVSKYHYSDVKKWRAYIKVNGKFINLGKYETTEEAACAYDKAAVQYFGEFALLNFPKEEL